MTTDTDMDLDPNELASDPVAEQKLVLEREVNRITAEIDTQREIKAVAAERVRTLLAQRAPLERALRALSPRPKSDD